MILREGARGGEVRRLQEALAAAGFPPGAADGDFGPATRAALLAFQRSAGLLADGVAGPRTLAALARGGAGAALPEAEAEDVTPRVSADLAARMFPHTPRQNIEANLPHILDALRAAGHVDRAMVLTALATIRAETEGFLPIGEGESSYNTSPGGHPFDLYDRRRDLGNEGSPDGARYRGRGYVQLTGKDNYRRYGAALGADLLDDPDAASAPELAARILVAFLADKERRIKEGVLAGDLAAVRRLVNGGSHGLDRFREAFETGARLLDGG